MTGSRDDRTVFQPGVGGTTPPDRPSAEAAPAAEHRRRIQIGDVLNHIFEVRRFIDRGGMGEVFEGINVNTDERVAIKVILPHLAADPSVQAMFRKEARTLTRLTHSALVQYRVLAQEPQLGVFYIVTEYVDGENLSNVLTRIKPTIDDLTGLTRRLAEGLQAAHSLGAIHRDMSADNVMLEGGRLDGAKIIDFGIAKDLDPGSATIVGDGFAGKLNYVAPEQLGDFDRQIGPWTDVYSLALVILAVAQGKDVDMGSTLVDAIDRRRSGPNLDAIPRELLPVIEKMLKPNPADRARSMGEVLELLGFSRGTSPPRPLPIPRAVTPKPVEKAETPAPAKRAPTRSKMPLIAGGGAVLALIVAGGLYYAFAGGKGASGVGGGAASGHVPSGDAVAAARAALDQGLPGIGCTWLNIGSITDTPQGLAVVLRGVAGKPAEAQNQVAQFLTAKGLKVAGLNFEDVSPIQGTECTPLENFRQIRDLSGGRLAVAQRQFEMTTLGDIGEDAGKIGATAVIDISLAGDVRGAALFGLEESGKISPILPDRASFDQEGIENLGNGHYRLPLATTHKGWSGVLLLTGKPPFNPELIGGVAGSRGADWRDKFVKLSKDGGWKSEMVWYKTVDDQPNGPAAVSSVAASPAAANTAAASSAPASSAAAR